jgi:hypothetical protein
MIALEILFSNILDTAGGSQGHEMPSSSPLGSKAVHSAGRSDEAAERSSLALWGAILLLLEAQSFFGLAHKSYTFRTCRN